MYLETASILGLEEYFPLGQVLFTEFNDVKLFEKKTSMNISLRSEEEIQQRWRRHLATHPEDFDGSLGSVMEMHLHSGRDLNIKFHQGRFSQFYCTFKTRGTWLNLEDNPLDRETCLPISFGAVLVTKPTIKNPQGCIVFAERKETAFESNTLTLLPGGYFNPQTDFFMTQRVGIFRKYSIICTILRELFEETGIILNSVRPDYLGVVYSKQGSRQPLIACSIRLAFAKEELTFDVNEESRKIFFIDNNLDSVIKFIKGKRMAIHDAWKLILYFDKILNK